MEVLTFSKWLFVYSFVPKSLSKEDAVTIPYDTSLTGVQHLATKNFL
jgi:hypothetical protein